MGDPLPPEAKRARGARLRDLSERAGLAHRTSRIGTHDEVLVEKAAPDGAMTGFGADYTRFVLPAGSGAPGEMVPVLADGLAGEHVRGRPLAEAVA
jgi:tRNA A37 methylthiotransferase MiaB